MMDWNGHMTTGGWIFSLLGMIIILALVVATITWIVRELNDRRDRGPTNAMTARNILDRRLASGEITTEQYEQLRHTLGVRSNAPPELPPAQPANARG